ncbi:interleukin-21 receptor isoform X1 [Hippocampus zosterae]|uniref:interleukin-21 receptor isoform X1 n=1 Tax=Hippocampus zosterae TaxID=109293 RepID=UPI00223E624C|nr:interleukin-21 receptor isoform X1 [Hippocampus zosterae]
MEKLKAMLLLLHTALSLADTRESFQCDNDYMLTISCSLNLTSGRGTPHWLTFAKLYTSERYNCNLSNVGGDRHSCFIAVKKPCDFMDFDAFEISLCGGKKDVGQWCQLMDERYKPKDHIKPHAPCCLAVSHNSSQHRFTWKNTYEKCRYVTLKDNLDYQIRFSNRQDKNSTRVHYTDGMDYSVNDGDLETDTEYSTKVRSKPSATHFHGQWSDWSQEVHWRTVPANDSGVDGFFSIHGISVFLASAVTATLVLFLCCALLKKWRQSAFVPTPAPYFQSLYTNCHGDFKSWMDTQANVTFTVKPEDTLRVDGLVEERPTQVDEMVYENLKSHPASLPPDEGKAACRPGRVPLIQGQPGRSCPEYCTISDLQQCAQVTGNVTKSEIKHTGKSVNDYCNDTEARMMLSGH